MRRFAKLVALGAAVALPWLGSARSEPLATYWFFDVGQGDGALLQAGTWQMVTDFGPDDSLVRHLGQHLPRGDRQLEVALISHPHADHYRGLRSVLRHYQLERLLVPAHAGDVEYQDVLKQARDQGVQISLVDTPQVVASPSVINVQLTPAPVSGSSNPNDHSIVSLVTVAGARLLSTGDAEQAEEAALLRKGGIGPADILKAGHHGSRTSTSPELLAAVQPRTVVISCGARNRYGHPARHTTRAISGAGARLWRTDQNGSVRVQFSPSGYGVTSER